jgi:exonuclease III
MMGIILSLLLFVSTGAASSSNLQCVGLQTLFASADSAKAFKNRTDLKVVSLNGKDLFVYRPLPSKKDFIQENPDPQVNREKPPEKIQQLIRVLRDIKPDILVLQEVIGTHSSHILDPKQEYVHITTTPKDVRGLHTVFLVRADLNVDVQLIIPTLTAPHAKIHRGLPYIKIRQKDEAGKVDRAQNPDLIIIGVHLKPYRNEEGSQHFSNIKTEEVQQIIKLLKELEAKYPQTGIMVAGDFNADLNVRPEVIALKALLQDSLDYSVGSKDREGRSTQTFHSPRVTEPAQLDAILMNQIILQHLVSSYVYRYRDSSGHELRYRDAVGNTVSYPTSYELRELNASDHNPVVAVLNMTRKIGKSFQAIPKHQQTLRGLFREVTTAKGDWGMNDTMMFKVDLQGETQLFLRWLETSKLNSYISIMDVKNNTVYLQSTITGMGYLLLKDSENSASWIRNVHFQAL